MKLRYQQPARLGDHREIKTQGPVIGVPITFRQEATKAGESSALATAKVEVVSLDAPVHS